MTKMVVLRMTTSKNLIVLLFKLTKLPNTWLGFKETGLLQGEGRMRGGGGQWQACVESPMCVAHAE